MSSRKFLKSSKKSGVSSALTSLGIGVLAILGLVVGYGFLTSSMSGSRVTTETGPNSTVTLTQSINGGTQTQISTQTQTVTSVSMITQTVTSVSTIAQTETTVQDITSYSTVTIVNTTSPYGPLFAILGIYVFSENDSVKLVVEALSSPIVLSANFGGSADNDAIPNTSLCNQTNGGVTGQITVCSASGFQPPIMPPRTDSIYSISISAFVPGNTELFVTQTYDQSYLTVQ